MIIEKLAFFLLQSKRSPFPIHYPVDSTYPRGSILGLYEALVGKPYLCDMVTDSVALCIEIKLESIMSVLSRGNGVEELLWKVSFDNLCMTLSATQNIYVIRRAH